MRLSVTTPLTAERKPEILAWDSEFWRLKIGRADTSDVDQWAIDNTVGLVCLLIDTDRPDEAQAAEERGYRFVDARVTLARPTAPYASSARMHRDSDLDRLVEIARGSHRITRFYADPRLPDERCDDLYESWVRQSCAGWADRVLVAESPAGPAGYVTVHLGEVASIGLIAVDESTRRTGLGRELVLGAIDYAHSQGADAVSVVTQGRNIAAQRLFQACGFRTTTTELWFHKHIDYPPSARQGPRW